ncbi:hypothetical protein ACFWPV_31525 [Streptomyces uncialis]|uniref:hypothetical protein n=1 Tax=Streptomyces uncialis TaxID=1048205 RepID=UPI0036680A80
MGAPGLHDGARQMHNRRPGQCGTGQCGSGRPRYRQAGAARLRVDVGKVSAGHRRPAAGGDRAASPYGFAARAQRPVAVPVSPPPGTGEVRTGVNGELGGTLNSMNTGGASWYGLTDAGSSAAPFADSTGERSAPDF